MKPLAVFTQTGTGQASLPRGHFSAQLREFTTMSSKATKGVEHVYEDAFVLFVSVVVELIFSCGRGLRCDLNVLCGELFSGCSRRPRCVLWGERLRFVNRSWGDV